MTQPVLMTSTAKRVIGHVAARSGIPEKDILSRARRRSTSAARRRAARIFWRLGYSSTDIGFALNRDHSTILYLVRTERRYGRAG